VFARKERWTNNGEMKPGKRMSGKEEAVKKGTNAHRS